MSKFMGGPKKAINFTDNLVYLEKEKAIKELNERLQTLEEEKKEKMLILKMQIQHINVI